MAVESAGIIAGLKREASDIGMVLAMIGILTAMILPLHPMILDFFLALNVTLAVIVLITTMYTKTPLDFSIFPSMLLVLTLLGWLLTWDQPVSSFSTAVKAPLPQVPL